MKATGTDHTVCFTTQQNQEIVTKMQFTPTVGPSQTMDIKTSKEVTQIAVTIKIDQIILIIATTT